MFLGRHDHNLDGKGRLAVPSRFREELADGIVLTRGIDRCITLYPLTAWDVLASRVRALPIADSDARQFRRFVFAEAVALWLDGQGRILIPPPLRSYAAIDRETIVVGVHDAIEIWCPSLWGEVNDALDASGDRIARRLAELM